MDAIDAFGPLALTPRAKPGDTDLAEAARAFEGLLLGSIQSTAARPLGGEHLLDGGSAGRMAREMWLQELASIAVRNGGLGLAELFETSEPNTQEPSR